MTETTQKWFWMMDYCKKQGWNPAFAYYWKLAERAYNERTTT